MHESLTIQTYVNGQWHDALDLSISNTQAVASTRITASYKTAYLHGFYDVIDSIFEHAVSVNLPVNWSAEETKGFPAFVLDIIPAGYAKKSLSKRFNLRAEYHYYKAVSSLGLNTVSTQGLSLEEAQRPSLWMPRFDRVVNGGSVGRIAVESVYSLLGNTEPGSRLKHEVVLAKLIELWCLSGQAGEVPELIFEYIRRDLLNRILGNSDNHGRNTSIFRYRGRFDLAPMVLDAEGVTRATKWEAEKKGSPQWREICACFPQWYAPDDLYERIRGAAHEFRALPDLLVDMPLDVRQSKAIPVNNLDSSFELWRLV
ncbi:HipA domain-containing protein [Halopseudomonas bauzanensis]|uniref:HipA domain-containing protein n=1 Tax=Halopseudomonas bauzanensis TaxID=653930 RepID=UPI003523CF72